MLESLYTAIINRRLSLEFYRHAAGVVAAAHMWPLTRLDASSGRHDDDRGRLWISEPDKLWPSALHGKISKCASAAIVILPVVGSRSSSYCSMFPFIHSS